MKKSLVCSALTSIMVVSLLIGCSPSTNVVQNSTPVPLAGLNLEPYLIQSGDLPAGYSGVQAVKVADDTFPWVSNHGINNIYQQLQKNGNSVGNITVFLYDSTDQRDLAYKQLINGMGIENQKNIDGIGEKGTYSVMDVVRSGKEIMISELVFVRCNALINITMSETKNIDDLSAYAKKLDARLQPLVCAQSTK
jgi:hypothetical protein